MADIEVLRESIEALFPASLNPRFGRVPKGVSLPWTRVDISLPSPNTRAMNGRALSNRVVVRVRVAGVNEASVVRVGRNAITAIDNARATAIGWGSTPMRLLNTDPMPYEDTEMVLSETNSHPVVLPLDFDFYATVKETP